MLAEERYPQPGRLLVLYLGAEDGGRANTDACTRANSARVPLPSVSGMRVDRCLYWAQQCDQPAATRFCQSQGMSVAVNWAWEHDTPTYVLGDGRVCQAPNNCGGFSTITCQ